VDVETIDRQLDRVGAQPFRAKFHLRGREREMVQRLGPLTIRRHAVHFISARLAPAVPAKDGKQTPYRGHPVFVAQHATATCCRGCLARWHGIAKGHELSDKELMLVIDTIARWIEREMAPAPFIGRHQFG
jgi:hypothetical protein